MIDRLKELGNHRLFSQWVQQIFVTAIVCFLYLFSEWVFTLSKPSFLGSANWGQRTLVLGKSFVYFACLAFAILIILGILSVLLGRKAGNTILAVSGIIPSAILTSLLLLLVDNFTYTVFKFGILTSSGFVRAAYTGLFFVLLYFSFRFFSLLLTLKTRHTAAKSIGAAAFLIIFVAFTPSSSAAASSKMGSSSASLPNILLIGSDGLAADHMSVYGYERETTPNISKFAKDALVVKNAFSNSSNTSASVLSMLDGKYPTRTHVFYPPDMLSGVDAIQHLPSLLKNMGYYNAEWTIPHYADMFSLGMLHGFDEVNGVLAEQDTYTRLRGSGFAINDAYFLASVIDRITERLLHLLYIKNALNPYDFVTEGTVDITDQEKIDAALAALESHPSNPVFVHLHLVGTHGGTFEFPNPVFSAGEEQNKYWMTDFYDDSILYLDTVFGSMIDSLQVKGLLDNTIVILYSDHGEQWNDKSRVPLIIRFPNGEYHNVEIDQAQNLDVAPTIVDYLNITEPAWMNGSSLIDPSFRREPVISSGTTHGMTAEGGWILDTKYLQPPFFQMDYVHAIDCQHWINLNLDTYEVTEGTVENYSTPCRRNELLPTRDVLDLLMSHLSAGGYVIPPELNYVLSNHP